MPASAFTNEEDENDDEDDVFTKTVNPLAAELKKQ
jgi:hypothetical protein